MWWTGNAVGLDFESDGIDPEDARIIQWATVQVSEGRQAGRMEMLVKPERPIPQGAIDVHGITTERAEAEGAERETALRSLVEQLSVAGETCPVVGHNIAYDLTVLDRELRRTGVGCMVIEGKAHPRPGQVVVLVDGLPITRFPVIDTYVLDKAVDKWRPGSRKLEATARHYGAPMAEGTAHGASADVIAALRIAIAIANRTAGSTTGALTPAEMHAQQAQWAWDQRMGPDGLRQYFLKKGNEEAAASVDGSWPLRTLTDGASPVETTEN